MKKILPVIAVAVLLIACDHTKIQLRAPKAQTIDGATVKTVNDSAKTDTTKLGLSH